MAMADCLGLSVAVPLMHALVVSEFSRAAQQSMQPPLPERGFSRANSASRLRNG